MPPHLNVKDLLGYIKLRKFLDSIQTPNIAGNVAICYFDIGVGEALHERVRDYESNSAYGKSYDAIFDSAKEHIAECEDCFDDYLKIMLQEFHDALERKRLEGLRFGAGFALRTGDLEGIVYSIDKDALDLLKI